MLHTAGLARMPYMSALPASHAAPGTSSRNSSSIKVRHFVPSLVTMVRPVAAQGTYIFVRSSVSVPSASPAYRSNIWPEQAVHANTLRSSRRMRSQCARVRTFRPKYTLFVTDRTWRCFPVSMVGVIENSSALCSLPDTRICSSSKYY
jgi:hypothetical protein